MFVHITYHFIGDKMTLESIKEEIALRRREKTHPVILKKRKRYERYFTKIFITIIITLSLLIALKSNKTFESVFYQKVYEENIPFSKFNELYKKYFGTSIPFSGIVSNPEKKVFGETLKYESKTRYEEGVKLNVGKEYLAPVLDSGMVVFIGEKENYGNTVIIQQIDGKDVWYSNLENVNVSLYDYVEKGSLLGEVKDEDLILIFKKDGKVLDYEKELS